MPKYFSEDVTALTGENAAHFIRSLRGRVGDMVIVCDGAGMDYECTVAAIDQDVKLDVRNSHTSESEPRIRVSLYQALPKGDKMETIIQKCVELGVFEICPINTEHVIPSFSEAKKRRYEKVSEAAAKQSMRGIIPKIAPVRRLEEVLNDSAGPDLMFAAYEREKQADIKTFLKAAGIPRSIGFFIGPEGGFSPGEMALFQENNIAPVSLGKRILRTETAAPAVLTAIMYEFDELGVGWNGEDKSLCGG